MKLHINPYIVENEEKRLFIVHGINEHSGRYENFARFLNSHNISVITYDLRGHGKSPGKKGYIKSFKDHITDLSSVIEEYSNSNVKQYLLGHSMGGLIGHMYMVTDPKVEGYIAVDAPTNYLSAVKPFKVIGYRWLGFIKLRNKFARGNLTNDKEIEEAYRTDPLVGKYFYVRLAGEMFLSGVKYLNTNINNHTKPILILHGEDDNVVPIEHSLRIYELINHDNKKIITYENMNHEILNEIDKHLVYNDILEWLNEK